MPRRLSPDERALWAKVVQSVRPIHATEELEDVAPVAALAPAKLAGRTISAPPEKKKAPTQVGTTLDGSWDKRLSQGTVQPDVSIDLHGHNLDTAYFLLDRRLDQAIAAGARIVLLITGKPPKGEPPIARGRIRAAVGDWLAASRHAGDIAAVRNAHPRHGGAGALYIVLRRRK